MKEEEKQRYELIFKQLELIESSYINEILRLVKDTTFYEPKSQEFGLLLQALGNARASVHDLDLYLKIVRNRIVELRMSYDSSKV
ncbi:MAG TPA: hypothetical protein VF974_07535 [Patescibacteria group bacterium]